MSFRVAVSVRLQSARISMFPPSVRDPSQRRQPAREMMHMTVEINKTGERKRQPKAGSLHAWRTEHVHAFH